MANKDHSLDGPILEAAMQEFLDKGYEKASLRKIAGAAGVTVGAIYTRWPSKDLLIRTLAEPLLRRIGCAFQEIRAGYVRAETPAEFVGAMKLESDTILHLLFDDRDRAELVLCRSTGSSLEHFFDQVVEEKIRQTEAFFAGKPDGGPDSRVLRLLIGAQFHMYQQVMEQGWPLEEARRVMDSVMACHAGGWEALLGLGHEKGSVSG